MAEGSSFDLKEPVREITRGVLQGIWDWFRGRNRDDTNAQKRGILIIGSGGTGKSTLARVLSGQFDWFDECPGRYVESVDLECFPLADDPGIDVVVAPGQTYRRASTWPELLKQIAGGEFRGVIAMNAYGYHTFSTPSYRNHVLFSGSKSDFLTAYFADRREEELRVLKQLVPYLSVSPEKMWLLSAVTKQDLWVGEQGPVEDHYRDGAYAKEVTAIAQTLGDRYFRHEVVFLSLIIRNLETIAGERLASTTAGYDIKRIADSFRHLLNVFSGLRTWEGER